MNTLYTIIILTALGVFGTVHTLAAILWLLNYVQPFAVEYFKHRLDKRQL